MLFTVLSKLDTQKKTRYIRDCTTADKELTGISAHMNEIQGKLVEKKRDHRAPQ